MPHDLKHHASGIDLVAFANLPTSGMPRWPLRNMLSLLVLQTEPEYN